MSVIAAIYSNVTSSAWVASDTLISSGNLRLFTGPKWVVCGSWAVGVAGHLRTINVFQNRAEQLLANLGNAYEFSQRARDILSADGYRSPKDDEGPCDFGQMLMLANSGGVWTVGSDFSLTELPADSMWAEGSGRELAIGAAHAIQSAFPEISPEEVIRLAVETAVAKDVGCGGAVWISELNAGRKSAP